MFYYILFVIWCYCNTLALLFLLEQPDTRVPDFFLTPSQRIRTSELGEDDDKTVCLYERGRRRLRRTHPPGGTSKHGHLHDFKDHDDRDRWRSPWFPSMLLGSALVASGHQPLDSKDPPSFEEARELFAILWYLAGLPVPYDYDARPDALPILQEDRDYLHTRGKGHGRRVRSVLPRSMRAGAHSTLALTFRSTAIDHHQLDLRMVTAHSLMLCFVAMQSTPLIFSFLNGFDVLGAELHVAAARSSGLAIATRWAEQAIQSTSSTFLVGEYVRGARLFAAPLNYNPSATDVVRTPAQRRTRAKSGVLFAWCTLAALAGCLSYDPPCK